MGKINVNNAIFEPKEKVVDIVFGDKRYHAFQNLKEITSTTNQPLILQESQIESTIDSIEVISQQIEKPTTVNLPQTNIVITDIAFSVVGDTASIDLTIEENLIVPNLGLSNVPHCLVVKNAVGVFPKSFCIDLSQAGYLSVTSTNILAEFNASDFTLSFSGTFVSCEQAFLTNGMRLDIPYGSNDSNYIEVVQRNKETIWNKKVKLYHHSFYGKCICFYYFDNPDEYQWYRKNALSVAFSPSTVISNRIRFDVLNGLTVYSNLSTTTNRSFVRNSDIFIHELSNIYIEGTWTPSSIVYDKEKLDLVTLSASNTPIYIENENGSVYYEDFPTALEACVDGDRIYVTANTNFNELGQGLGYMVTEKNITIILSDGITFGGAMQATNCRITISGKTAKLVDFSLKLFDATFDITAKKWYNPAWKGSTLSKEMIEGTNDTHSQDCFFNVDEVLTDLPKSQAGATLYYRNKASRTHISFKTMKRNNQGSTVISLAGQCSIKGEYLEMKGFGHPLALQNDLDDGTSAFHSYIQITEVISHCDSGDILAANSEAITIEDTGGLNINAHYHIVDTNVKILTSGNYDPAQPFAAIRIIKDNLHLHNVKVNSSIEEAAVIVGGTYVTAEIDNCEIINTGGKALIATQFLGQTTVKNSILEGNSINAVVDIGILNNITNIKIQNSEIRNKHVSGEVFYVGNCVGSNISGNDFVLDGNLLVGKNELFNRDALLVITDATKASSCVLSIADADDWCRQGSKLLIKSVVGMTELNNNTYTVTAVSSTTVTINVDSTSFTTYVSGGTAQTVIDIKIRRDNLTSASNTASDYIILKENSSGIIVDSDIT